jgi:PAT family beta-lactamase induction signal transducer AmpG
MFSSLFIENFCSGMSATALLVFLTSLCHQRYSATQFACLSALDSIGRVFLGPLAAIIVLHSGWVSFYGWSFILCFPGIIILTLLRNRVKFNVELAA